MSEKKEGMKCDLNENDNDVLDLPSLEIVTFGWSSLKFCHVAVFESMWWLLIFTSFLILDLPKLHSISFHGGYALRGDNRDNRKTMINGHESYDNTLIMKSKLKWNEMWIVLWWWLFRSSFTHWNKGKLLIYSRFCGICDIGKYDLIWFDLILIDIPNLTIFNSNYGTYSFISTAYLQATSTFPFQFHFHVLDAPGLEKYIRSRSDNLR